MYVDLGRQRGRVRFTWREVVAVVSVVTSGLGYVLHTELTLASVKQQLATCQAEVRQLQAQQGINYTMHRKAEQGQ